MVVFGMSMSLDGFIKDEDGSVSALYPDFAELYDSDYMRGWQERTGAVLMGRHTFDMAGNTDSYADNYEHQGPIFVITHRPPERHPKENERLTITFVTTGVKDAVTQAKGAAQGKEVSVLGGPDLLRQLLEAGLVDRLQISVIPVLLGKGLRLFDGLGDALPPLEQIGVETVSTKRVDLLYRVLRVQESVYK